MENKLSYLKLNLKATESHRLSWNGQYFNLEGILLLDSKIESKEQARKNLESCSLIVKMTPFKNEFKAKLFSHILGEEKEEQSNIIAFTASINVFEKKVLDILDIREAQGVVSSFGHSPLNSGEALVMTLTSDEKNSLQKELQKLLDGPMLAHLREPFVCFFPEFATNEWKERIPKNKSKTALIPFQAIFPFSGAIERVYKDQLFALDDLYCVAPACDCNEVNCIVLTIDAQSGQEVVYGGFKYNFEKKTFKNMPDFPTQFNSQEWFKQFSANQPVSLPLLFEERYHFLRFITK
ncbi:MAG: hypothetical protein V4591_08185 [Bdellovibrionota bacterium]